MYKFLRNNSHPPRAANAYLFDGRDNTGEACSKAPDSQPYDQGRVSGGWNWKEQLLRFHSKNGGW